MDLIKETEESSIPEYPVRLDNERPDQYSMQVRLPTPLTLSIPGTSKPTSPILGAGISISLKHTDSS